MARRVVNSALRDRRKRILGLTAPNQGWAPISAAEAIAQIRLGVHQYWLDAAGTRRQIFAYKRSGRWYLRARGDAGLANNLRSCDPPDPNWTLTGGFDALLSLSEQALQQGARAMHEAGVLFQHEIRVADGRIVEMCLGCPRIERFKRVDGAAAFAITTSIACWVSRADDPTDPGFNAMATTKTQARLTAPKLEKDGLLRLTLSYEPRPPGEVALHGQMTSEQRGFLEAVLEEWTGARGSDTWAGEMPATPGKVTALAADFSAKDDLQVGLGFEGGFSSSGLPDKADAEQPGAWSLALSRPLLARRVHEAFAAQLGAAPPPFGSSSVVLSQSEGVYLDFLDLELADGEILVCGQISRSGFAGMHAQFTAHVSLTLTAAGLISPSVADVDVEIAEWYANVADVLSGGAVTSALRKGIREALASPGAQGQLASFLTPDLLADLAVARTAANISIRPKITAVEVSRKGLRLIGTLETANPKAPAADLQAVAGQAGKTTLLYGARSAVPGSQLAEVRWDFGDGSKKTLTGADAALALGHIYTAGTHKPALTIVDADGRQASATTTVRVSA